MSGVERWKGTTFDSLPDVIKCDFNQYQLPRSMNFMYMKPNWQRKYVTIKIERSSKIPKATSYFILLKSLKYNEHLRKIRSFRSIISDLNLSFKSPNIDCPRQSAPQLARTSSHVLEDFLLFPLHRWFSAFKNHAERQNHVFGHTFWWSTHSVLLHTSEKCQSYSVFSTINPWKSNQANSQCVVSVQRHQWSWANRKMYAEITDEWRSKCLPPWKQRGWPSSYVHGPSLFPTEKHECLKLGYTCVMVKIVIIQWNSGFSFVLSDKPTPKYT